MRKNDHLVCSGTKKILYGLSLDTACRLMAQRGLDVTLHSDWGIVDLRDCLRDGWYPIVGVNRRFFGQMDSPHAIVLIEIGSQAIQALVPLGSSAPVILRPETFERAWISAGQEALVIKSVFPPDLV
jgi:hypothetical protein